MAIITRAPPLTAVPSAARPAMVLHHAHTYTKHKIHKISPPLWEYRHNMLITREVKSTHPQTHAHSYTDTVHPVYIYKSLTLVKKNNKKKTLPPILQPSSSTAAVWNTQHFISMSLITWLVNAMQGKRCQMQVNWWHHMTEQPAARMKSHSHCEEQFWFRCFLISLDQRE